MTTRRIRHLLSATATGFTLAAVGVVVWAVMNPPTNDPGQSDPGLEATNPNAPRSGPLSELPDRGELLILADLPLRQQLFDPPPPPPQQPPPPLPLPGVELISTILPSQGEPSAWVREPANGNTPRKVRVGDNLGPANNTATITAIEPDRLLVEHNGEVQPIERAASVSGGRR